MRSKTLIVPFVCFVLSIVLTPKTTEACVCSNQVLSDREDAAQQFAEAAVVFEGEVALGGREVAAPTQDKPGLGMIVFQVIRAYKGVHDKSIQLYDPMAGTDCGGWDREQAGGKYFVYGFQGTDGKIYLQACTRTGPLKSAGPDLRYARGEPATKEDLNPGDEKRRLLRDSSLATRGATLRGTVRRLDAADVSNVFLTVWDVDEEGRFENLVAATQKVNVDGSYEVRFLAPGHYKVTARDSQMTTTTQFVGESGNISLAERQTLDAVNVTLRPEPLGKVTIKVNAPPELHDRVLVLLRDVEMDLVGTTAPYHYSQNIHLNDESVASFEFVPYGCYNVYVNLTGEDLTKPLWTHDKVQVQLNGNHAETVVTLRRNH